MPRSLLTLSLLAIAALPLPAAAQLQPSPAAPTRQTHSHGALFIVNPNAQFGGLLYGAVSPALNLFGAIQASFGTGPSGKYYDNISPGEASGWGDEMLGIHRQWIAVSAGVVLPVPGPLSLYAGAGYATDIARRVYADPTCILGDGSCQYSTDAYDDEVHQGGLGMAGGIIEVGKWRVLAGYQTLPDGFTLGVGRGF